MSLFRRVLLLCLFRIIPTGAVIAGGAINLVHQGTKESRQARANERGESYTDWRQHSQYPAVLFPAISATGTVTPPVTISTPLQLGQTDPNLTGITAANPVSYNTRTPDFLNAAAPVGGGMELQPAIRTPAEPDGGGIVFGAERQQAHHAAKPVSYHQ